MKFKKQVRSHPKIWSQSLSLPLIFLLTACGNPKYTGLSGYIPGYIPETEVLSWQKIGQNSTNFFVFVPPETPPAGGWPTLILLHPAGGHGQGMVRVFERAARRDRILLLAPTINEQPGITYDAAAIITHAILEKAKQQYAINSQNIVMFGYSQGGAIASIYAQRFPQDLQAVAIAAAPIFAYLPPGESTLKYAIAVGKQDPRYKPATRFVQEMKNRLYSVEFQVFPGLGHEFSPEYIDFTIKLVHSVKISLEKENNS